MSPAGFEPTFSAFERLLTYASDRAATGTGSTLVKQWKRMCKIPERFDMKCEENTGTLTDQELNW